MQSPVPCIKQSGNNVIFSSNFPDGLVGAGAGTALAGMERLHGEPDTG